MKRDEERLLGLKMKIAKTLEEAYQADRVIDAMVFHGELDRELRTKDKMYAFYRAKVLELLEEVKEAGGYIMDLCGSLHIPELISDSEVNELEKVMVRKGHYEDCCSISSLWSHLYPNGTRLLFNIDSRIADETIFEINKLYERYGAQMERGNFSQITRFGVKGISLMTQVDSFLISNGIRERFEITDIEFMGLKAKPYDIAINRTSIN